MITVVIPALNEESTIAHVVQLAKSSTDVTEVIVVDDKSFDKTVEISKKARATVITSNRLGKGASMKDGVLYANNPIIAFLDADTPGAANMIEVLRENGFIVGLMSDNYDCITNHLKNIYGFDFSLANELEFSRSVATGEVKTPSFFLSHEESICNHEYCKTHALMHICKKSNVPVADTLAVGNSETDICILKKSGIGVSFSPSNPLLDTVADFVIKEPVFDLLLPIIN